MSAMTAFGYPVHDPKQTWQHQSAGLNSSALQIYDLGTVTI